MRAPKRSRSSLDDVCRYGSTEGSGELLERMAAPRDAGAILLNQNRVEMVCVTRSRLGIGWRSERQVRQRSKRMRGE
jgi:hypothetical protein